MRNINECIACRAFASLILDSEYPAADNLPAFVSCRILVGDLYQETVTAETRAEAIEYSTTGTNKKGGHEMNQIIVSKNKSTGKYTRWATVENIDFMKQVLKFLCSSFKGLEDFEIWDLDKNMTYPLLAVAINDFGLAPKYT